MIFIILKLFHKFNFEINKSNFKQFLKAFKNELEKEHNQNLENMELLKKHIEELKKIEDEEKMKNLRERNSDD